VPARASGAASREQIVAWLRAAMFRPSPRLVLVQSCSLELFSGWAGFKGVEAIDVPLLAAA
jgi:hypothetical protein